MAENYGKQFEGIIKEAFEKIDGVSIDRLYDQMSGFAGSKNICDFIVYKIPYEFYIECKSVHGNTMPFRNIAENQWNGLLEKSKIEGVRAGVMCWWIDYDITIYISIAMLDQLKKEGLKSISYNGNWIRPNTHAKAWTYIQGKKKRVFFDYDLTNFFEEVRM